MKKKLQAEKNTWIEKFHHVRHFSTDETTQHKPLADKKGIHCEGNRFDYIVEWQVDEKKSRQVNM